MNKNNLGIKIIWGILFFIFMSNEVNAQTPTVISISPNIGINRGTMSVTITGSDFASGATVTLTKNGTSIIGIPTIVIQPNTITTTFDLKGAQIGSWSVVVTNPDNQSGTLTDGFKVIPQLLITEVYYDTAISNEPDEFIEIYNSTPYLINLSGYNLSDTEGTHTFPTGSVLPAYDTITIARKGTQSYQTLGNRYPDFEWNDTDPNIPDVPKTAGSPIGLSNSGDEVLLLDDAGIAIDVVTYENGTYTEVISHPGVNEGKSLQRLSPNQDTNDCSVDFQGGTPTPTILRNIIISPTVETVGSFVTISGQGFFATEEIVIDFDTTSTITTTTTDATGSFSTTFTIQPGDGTVTVSATGKTSNAKVTTKFNIILQPLLMFTKEVTPTSTVSFGGTLTYTLYYKNVGLGTATNVVLIDAIPVGITYITDSALGVGYIYYSHDGGITYDDKQTTPVTHIRWSLIGDIAPGDSGSVRFEVRSE